MKKFFFFWLQKMLLVLGSYSNLAILKKTTLSNRRFKKGKNIGHILIKMIKSTFHQLKSFL